MMIGIKKVIQNQKKIADTAPTELDDISTTPSLECDEVEVKERKGLKILTPNNLLTRLPTSRLELSSGSYSVSDIQDYIEYIIKNMIHYLLIILFISIYINRINNRLVFKTEDRCKLELQTPGTMKLFGSAKKINKQHKE